MMERTKRGMPDGFDGQPHNKRQSLGPQCSQPMSDEEDEASGSDNEPQSNNTSGATPRSTKRKARTTGSPASHTSGCRFDSSLGMLTKKFLKLIDDTLDGVLDLNKAAVHLNVQKRRIYDITNVLEGIGLIKKENKNHIRWKGSSSDAARAAEPEVCTLRGDLLALADMENSLDDQLARMSAALQTMADDPLNRSLLYVTNEDITALPCFAADTLFAVKAPDSAATTMEVPDPLEPPHGHVQAHGGAAGAEGGGPLHYRLSFRTNGHIEVYLVQHATSDEEGQQQKQEQEEQQQADTAAAAGTQPAAAQPQAAQAAVGGAASAARRAPDPANHPAAAAAAGEGRGSLQSALQAQGQLQARQSVDSGPGPMTADTAPAGPREAAAAPAAGPGSAASFLSPPPRPQVPQHHHQHHLQAAGQGSGGQPGPIMAQLMSPLQQLQAWAPAYPMPASLPPPGSLLAHLQAHQAALAMGLPPFVPLGALSGMGLGQRGMPLHGQELGGMAVQAGLEQGQGSAQGGVRPGGGGDQQQAGGAVKAEGGAGAAAGGGAVRQGLASPFGMGSPSRNMFADALGASPHMYHGHSIFNSPMARHSPMALGMGMGGVGMGLSGRTPDLAEGGWWTDNPFATNCMELYGNEGKSIYDDL